MFHKARSLEVAQRAAFLDEHCSDSTVRDAVEALLQAEVSHGPGSDPAMMETIAGTPSAGVADLSEKPGDVIGPYSLVEQIGEGGFGVVYRAEQSEPVRREVALKIIKLGMDTRQVIGRFEAERQALAMMDHPGIATVLDAGATDSGRPYFVMELVKGQPITDYSDTHCLDFDQRLKLFMQVCGAVQHAHQKGIIHRDIKPSNVLVTTVDGQPVPKVIDFGIAKATDSRLTDRTMFTEIGQFIGTPAYMSPEQADPSSTDIDTRSDIYSLGVLLYELLTGAPPFDVVTMRGAVWAEVQRIICEEEPSRPSTRVSKVHADLDVVARQRSTDRRKLNTTLRGDLDWIIMKALEKDRTRRYESASGFALDIERYLNHEPVTAGPPSSMYRLRKFVRRNRSSLAGVAVVMVTLAISVVTLSYSLASTKRERDAKEHALIKVKEQRDAKEAALLAMRQERDAKEAALAEAHTQSDITAAVNHFLTEDLLLNASPLRSQQREMTLREAVDRAAASVEQRFDDQPRVAAQIEATLGRTYGEIGKYELAEKHGHRALELMTAQRGPDARETLELRRGFGELDIARGRFAEGAEAMAALLEDSTRVFGADDLLTLTTKLLLAQHRAGLTQVGPAGKLLKELIPDLERVAGPDHEHTLSARSGMAMLYLAINKEDKAVEILEDVVARLERAHGSDTLGIYASKTSLLTAYYEAGRSQDALTLGVPLLEEVRRVLGDDHHLTLNAINNLSNAYSATDQHDTALALRMEDLEASRRNFGSDHVDTLVTMSNLGRSLITLKRFDEAEMLLAESLERHQRLMPFSPGTSFTKHSYGECLVALERYAEAIPHLESAYPQLLLFNGTDYKGIPRLCDSLITAYEGMGNAKGAAKWKKRREKFQDSD
jgi:non-specific serine/threonine protein kinase/serine/threonine-protein kinase